MICGLMCGMNGSREFTHFTIALSTTVQSKQNLHMRYVCVWERDTHKRGKEMLGIYELINCPNSRVLLEKWIVTDHLKKFLMLQQPATVPIFNQMNEPVFSPFRSILISSADQWLGIPSDLFPSGFPTKSFHLYIISCDFDTRLVVIMIILKRRIKILSSYCVISSLLSLHLS